METALINQPFKLPHPVAGFSYFAEDQVLTADHLNQLIHYFNYQQRETRAWLIGTGIICGLKISIDKAHVRITKGCGISSDGDLFSLPADLVLTHSAAFTDENAKYPFLHEISGLLQLSPDGKPQGATPLTEALLKDKIVALYLESYVKEPDFCSAENCDNQGKIQHNQLHVLLIPRGKVAALAPSIAEIAITLPEVFPTRAEIQKGHIVKLEDSGGKSGLQSRFTNAIAATQKSLTDALGEIKKQAALAPLLEPSGLSWASQLITAPNPASEVPGLQNIYAFYQDICQAYREWRDSLFQLTHSCTPDLAAHPKHLLLGDTTSTPDHPPHPFRHRFIPAGTDSALTPHLRRSQLLWQRLSDLTTAFNAARTTPPTLSSIKLLPTKNPGVALGERTRPVYYGTNYSGLWNVDSYLRGDLRPPLSYATATPTVFATTGWETDFYRLEGHLGKPLKDVEAQLKNLRREHNLCFEILAIQIEDDPTFAIPRPHRFFDLETAYHNQRTHLKLQLRDVDSFADRIGTSLTEGQTRIPSNDPKINLTETRAAAGQAKVHAIAAQSALPAKMSLLSDTHVQTFSTSYIGAITQSHVVNKNIGFIAGHVQTTPMDRFVQPEVSAKWKLWHDLLLKRRRNVAKLSTFEKFVEANHGLEHLGGVPRGGTLVLVYSASANEAQRIVKADFCLPYFSYFDLNSLEEEEAPVEPEIQTPLIPIIPPIWTQKYDWKVAELTPLSINTLLLAETLKIQTNLVGVLDFKVQENFKAFEFVANFGKTTTPVPNFTDFKDPLGLVQEEMEYSRQRAEKLRTAKKVNGATPDVDELIKQHEENYAKAAKVGFNLVAEESKIAKTEGRSVAPEYKNFIGTVANDTFQMESQTGKDAIKGVTADLAVTHKNDAFMVDNLKRINGIVGF